MAVSSLVPVCGEARGRDAGLEIQLRLLVLLVLLNQVQGTGQDRT